VTELVDRGERLFSDSITALLKYINVSVF